jgi:hypothetical protein
MPDLIPLSSIGSDPMSMQEHQAYLQALGVPLNPAPQQQVQRNSQGVVPIPKNIQGLADLLLRTGRARTPQDALIMAQYMINR